MKEPVLVILAAGMGSRYGNLKQLDTVGNNNEYIIDFSVYDGIRAGFKNLILIIRKENEQLFEDNLGRKIRPFINLQYVYQDVNNLPEPFICPKRRVKPWGTAHALLCCRDMIDGPFAVINADDYYGIESFRIMYRFLKEEADKDNFAMMGYRLLNTLSDNGTVTRGICEQTNGNLSKIVELPAVMKDGEHAISYNSKTETTVLEDCLCSMNFWGFTPEIFEYTSQLFSTWLKSNIRKTKAECVIPEIVGQLIQQDKVNVRVLNSECEWFGVTYPQDKPYVCQKLAEYKEKGLYPFNLWEEK